MKKEIKYWKGLEELNNDADFVESANKEFPEYLPVNEKEDSQPSRRDFLKLMGFSVAAASLAACETPVKKVIPYVNKPVDVDPGKANYYASSYVDGSNYCSVVVKTREGRPIHIEGNKLSKVSQGGVNAQTSASVLNLYDSSRLKNFTKSGSVFKKADSDKEITAALESIASEGGKIRIVSQTILSPSTKAVITKFKEKFAGTELVTYDPISASALLKANNGVVPGYDFGKAEVIVSFSADFLGTWISPVEYSKQYSSGRKLSSSKKTMSKHFQFESAMSLTGANADIRQVLKPTEEAHYLLSLYNKLSSKLGGEAIGTGAVKISNKNLDQAVKDLLENVGKSLVVSGSNDVAVQALVVKINNLLKAEGSTILTPSFLKQGSDESMASFVKELKAGEIDGVIFYNANPVYDYVNGDVIAKALSKAKLSVSFAEREDETAKNVTYVCPDYNYLESWGDANPKQGQYSIIQPAISPLFDNKFKPEWENRAAQDSLLVWAGESVSYYDFLTNYWSENILTSSSEWTKALHDGVYEVAQVEAEEIEAEESVSLDIDIAASINKAYKPKTGDIEVVFYESIQLGNGKYGNNSWLLELPDPISKVTWDNYAAISVSTSKEKNLKQGDVINLAVSGKTVALPVLIQPGVAKDTVAVALGYGRTELGKSSIVSKAKANDKVVGYKVVSGFNAAGQKAVGTSVYPLLTLAGSSVINFATGGAITNTKKEYKLAQTQTFQTIMGRQNIQEASFSEYKKDAGSGRYHPHVVSSKGVQKPSEVDAWAAPNSTSKKEYEANKAAGISEEVVTHPHPNHHWGLAIDLSTCTGCSACVISCHAENNVPVVGKDEVLRKRDMHWMRIDRYYRSQVELDEKEGKLLYDELEVAAENPEVLFQPMMCQHCNHAGCETVCPVAATNHSSEGLNQMAYNRCIGTRYCANNCPYKVRRFNWFNYSDNSADEREFKKVNKAMNDDLGKMVLNPDVTVRARGVMEKCSMCVQRIQSGKLEAKIDNRKVEDADINTACASACPADALVFGDMNNPNSNISKVLNEENPERAFHVLEEINMKPNVSYLTKIRNNK